MRVEGSLFDEQKLEVEISQPLPLQILLLPDFFLSLSLLDSNYICVRLIFIFGCLV